MVVKNLGAFATLVVAEKFISALELSKRKFVFGPGLKTRMFSRKPNPR
jgi:hypothetical protein